MYYSYLKGILRCSNGFPLFLVVLYHKHLCKRSINNVNSFWIIYRERKTFVLPVLTSCIQIGSSTLRHTRLGWKQRREHLRLRINVLYCSLKLRYGHWNSFKDLALILLDCEKQQKSINSENGFLSLFIQILFQQICSDLLSPRESRMYFLKLNAVGSACCFLTPLWRAPICLCTAGRFVWVVLQTEGGCGGGELSQFYTDGCCRAVSVKQLHVCCLCSKKRTLPNWLNQMIVNQVKMRNNATD